MGLMAKSTPKMVFAATVKKSPNHPPNNAPQINVEKTEQISDRNYQEEEWQHIGPDAESIMKPRSQQGGDHAIRRIIKILPF